ncbi:MAG: hypothetical protein JXA03_07040 [Bacteroidales bacterium]|nr:hypothetical protein [Bacteroidales bacterium]
MKYFSAQISKKQSSDTGMAMVLILLLSGLYFGDKGFFIAGTIALAGNMIVPAVYYPVAIVWFGLASVLGSVVSRILLSIFFFILVLPVGWFRRAAGKDSLYLRKWKQDKGSVMKVRDHWYDAGDLEKPF